VKHIRPKRPRLQLDPEVYEPLRKQVLAVMVGDASSVVPGKTCRSTTSNCSQQGSDDDSVLIDRASTHEGLHLEDTAYLRSRLSKCCPNIISINRSKQIP
jgi:hypothetical protein